MYSPTPSTIDKVAYEGYWDVIGGPGIRGTSSPGEGLIYIVGENERLLRRWSPGRAWVGVYWGR